MMVYKIGRTINNDIIINKENVSSHHADLHVNEDSLLIKDNDSSNGVWVNRRRVKSAIISFEDELLIANQIVDLKKYLRICNGKVNGTKAPDDWSDHFGELVQLESEFDKSIEVQDKKANKAMMYFRVSFLATAISGIVIRMMLSGNNLIYILISTVVFGMISLYFFNTSTKATQNKEKVKRIIRDQQKTKYICPNCYNFIPDSTYMMTLKDEYRCKFCKVLLYQKTYVG
jgi:predicted RNA-binding Zn-ribbon protein involved in translation (DUF1610 family)